MTTSRAVIATEMWHGSTGRALAQGLRALGWCVEEINIFDYVGRGKSRVVRAEARLFAGRHRAEFNHAILSSVNSLGAQFLLTVKGVDITAETLRALAANGVRTINFYPDFEFESSGYDRALLSAYSLVITTKSFQVEPLRAMLGDDRVAFVHHGYAPAAHRIVAPLPESEAAFARDILYIGNASEHKRDWLLPIAERLPDVRMLVAGNRWRELAEGTALARHVLGHPLPGEFGALEIGRSKINLGIHMGPATASGWQDFVSTRTFEIPACGGFMLHIDNAEVRTLFDVPGEIDIFATPDEMIAKIGYYLEHGQERRQIAARGHARAVPAYSVDARAREIAALL